MRYGPSCFYCQKPLNPDSLESGCCEDCRTERYDSAYFKKRGKAVLLVRVISLVEVVVPVEHKDTILPRLQGSIEGLAEHNDGRQAFCVEQLEAGVRAMADIGVERAVSSACWEEESSNTKRAVGKRNRRIEKTCKAIQVWGHGDPMVFVEEVK